MLKKSKKCFVSLLMVVAMIMTMIPFSAFANETTSTSDNTITLPTASTVQISTNKSINAFFANGTPITITKEIPTNGQIVELSGLTNKGTDAYVSWQDNGITKYVGVSKDITVVGGKYANGAAVSVPNTSITMTGGTVNNIYGGNYGMMDNDSTHTSTVTGNVIMNFSDDAVVLNLLHGGGAFNTNVQGTVYMNFNNVENMNDANNDIWPYINGGVYGNGPEGSRDIANGKMNTNAVVNNVEIEATNSNLYLLGAGGSGSTKVKNGKVTLNNCTLTSLYLSGINGEVENSTITAEDCTITDFAATNRGFVGTGEVSFVNSKITNFQTGATEGCFYSDSGTPDGSGITQSVIYHINGDTTITNAFMTPYITKEIGGTFQNTLKNVTIDSEKPLNMAISKFQYDKNLYQTSFSVPEDSTLTLNNVQLSIADNNTLENIGTIKMDNASSITIPEGATLKNAGTINGTVNGQIDQYVARVNGVGYDSLEAAINAAGETTNQVSVILLANTKENVEVAVNQNILLDLNGYTLDGQKKSGKATIKNNGTLVIKDSSPAQTGTIKRSENGETSAYYVLDNQSTLTIEGGNIYNNSGDGKNGASLIRNMGTSHDNPAALTIKGGTLQQDNFIAVKNGDYGVLNVQGGTIISKNNQAIQNWNTATISGGQMTGQVITWSYTAVPNNAQMNITGGVIDGSVQAINYDGKAGHHPEVIVSGNATIMGSLGTYTNGTLSKPTTDPNVAKILVQGGYFGKNVPLLYLDDSLNALLYQSNSPAPYSYYTSVAQAQGYAQPGDIVTQLPEGDSSTTYTVTLKGNNQTADQVLTVYSGSSIILPTPTGNNGYTFNGWTDGNNVFSAGTNITVNDNLIFSALWTPPYTGKYSYEITVAKTENGSVSVDKYATEGEEVTITVTPDKAFKLDELSVTTGGKDVEITNNGDGTYTFTMPSNKVTITASFIEDEDYVEPTPDPNMPFTDVSENDWFYGAVQYVYDNDMMNGVSDTSFAPNSNLTRAMMAAVLYNLEDQPTQADSTFTDVVEGSWYADAVNWAAANDIVSGYGDGIFGPNDNITREQMAAILYRYAEYKGYDISAVGDLSQFNDADSVSEWANEVMSWAIGAGLINGMGDGSVAPQGTATRAQVATVLMNFCENIAK